MVDDVYLLNKVNLLQMAGRGTRNGAPPKIECWADPTIDNGAYDAKTIAAIVP